jgi:hypothetical protein
MVPIMANNKTKEQLAQQAIAAGKTMGQFLRELPNANMLTTEQLQEFAKAYDAVRRSDL